MRYKVNDIFPEETGIYLISFETSSKVYIGLASADGHKYKHQNGFHTRWKNHLYSLRKNKSSSKKLQNAYNKYGESEIYFCVIENVKPEKCVEREQYWIDYYNSFNNGYNCSPTASSQLNFRHSKISKNKMSETKKEKFKNKIKKYEKEVISLYLNMNSIKEIRSKLKISRNIVDAILKNNNVKTRNKGDYVKKKVYVYNTIGDLLSTHDSVFSCSVFYKIDDRKIWQVLNQKTTNKTHKNNIYSLEPLTKEDINQLLKRKSFKWSEEYKKRASLRRTGKPGFSVRWFNIKQIDKNGNIIKSWKSLPEAMKDLGLKNSSSILRCIKGERNKYKDCSWEGEYINGSI